MFLDALSKVVCDIVNHNRVYIRRERGGQCIVGGSNAFVCVLLGNPVMYSWGYNISMSNPPSKNNHRRRFVSRRETREVDDARAMKIERAGDEANTGFESGTVKSQKETIFVGFCKMYYRVCMRIHEGKKTIGKNSSHVEGE